ncbi:hypothetical protein UFOVP555_40 [uncultured Caudovirales phage]|uniref:Uncharacterized protein n=1 Tax=uncultured Caudovirales phage TaxID=2100421 RepID=A0A6J5MRQ4_9CAUD|nr:hypothetical protein UFOVP555_40 [uncultured Caudovirales phage]
MTGKRRGPQPIHTPEVLARLVESRQAGHSWPACGAILGFNWRSLRDKLYRSGVKAGGPVGRPGLITPEHIAKGIALREQGHSWGSCGEVLGVKPDSLRLAMLRKGVNPAVPQSSIRLARPGVRPELKAKARELRAQGMCWKLIERELGVNWETLAQAIHRDNKQQKQS